MLPITLEIRSIAQQLAVLYESLENPADREAVRTILNKEIARARHSIRQSAREMSGHFLEPTPDVVTT